MKASTPIGPSLGLNAVRLSILSGAVTATLGAPAMAQESMEIELDPFEHTVFVPGEDTRDVLVTGVKTATITAGFNNVLIASRVEQETTFRLQGFGVSNALTGVSLVLPAGKGPVNVLASGGTTTIVMDTSNLPEDDGQDGGSGNENPDEDLGDLGGDFVCFPTRIRLIIRTVSSRRGRSLCMRSQTAGAPRLKRWAGTLRTCLSLQGISTSRQMCR